MTSFEIITIVISIFSIIMSILAILVSLIPYKNKIDFKVSINPFKKEKLQIKFLIINRSDKDFIISSFYLIRGFDTQSFSEKYYPIIK